MAYRSKSKTLVEAVTRQTRWLDIMCAPSLSREVCRGTKLDKRIAYVQTAEFEEWKRIRGRHGRVRAEVIAGRYEPTPTW